MRLRIEHSRWESSLNETKTRIYLEKKNTENKLKNKNSHVPCTHMIELFVVGVVLKFSSSSLKNINYE